MTFTRAVNPKFVEEQQRIPFDFAQGRLSTAIGAQYAPICAPDEQKERTKNLQIKAAS
jgi:hypothetical protein